MFRVLLVTRPLVQAEQEPLICVYIKKIKLKITHKFLFANTQPCSMHDAGKNHNKNQKIEGEGSEQIQGTNLRKLGA
jgi:hypothetical protein